MIESIPSLYKSELNPASVKIIKNNWNETSESRATKVVRLFCGKEC